MASSSSTFSRLFLVALDVLLTSFFWFLIVVGIFVIVSFYYYKYFDIDDLFKIIYVAYQEIISYLTLGSLDQFAHGMGYSDYWDYQETRVELYIAYGRSLIGRVFYFSTFFTMLWSILFLVSCYFSSRSQKIIMRITKLLWLFDFKQKPASSLGLISGVLVFALWVIGSMI